MREWSRWNAAWVCGAALMLSGCFGDGLNCGVDGDCYLGEFCSSGRCAVDPNYDPGGDAGGDDPCPGEGQTRCGELCVDTDTSALACGSCGIACSDGWVCRGGECEEPESDCRTEGCPAGSICDAQTAACVTGCAGDDGCEGGAVCLDGGCQCGPGTHLCGGECVDSRSTETCGGACEPCAEDANGASACSEDGACQIVCDDGFLSCGGACAACPAGEGSVECAGEACVASGCAEGTLRCGDTCAECPQDEHASFACDRDLCVVGGCDQGFRDCGGTCSECPGGAAVASTTCAQGACVVDQCVAGAAPCAQGCCVIVPAADGVIDSAGGRRPGVALTPGDLPVAVYDTGSEVRVASYDGVGSWVISAIGSGRAGGPKSVAVDEMGGVHVLYFSGDDVVYATAPGASATFTTRVIHTQQNADYGDLALRTSGGEVVGVWAGRSSVQYASLGGASVTVEEAADFVFGEPSGVDVGFLNDGSVRVSFTVNDEIHYARRRMQGWDDQRLNRSLLGGIDATHTSLVVSPGGTPAVLFDSADERAIEAFVYQPQTNDWSREVVTGQVSNNRNYQGFGRAVVDTTTTVHLAYIDYTTGTFEHGKSTAQAYGSARVDAVTGSSTWRPSLDVDSTDLAHVVYPRFDAATNTTGLYYKRLR